MDPDALNPQEPNQTPANTQPLFYVRPLSPHDHWTKENLFRRMLIELIQSKLQARLDAQQTAEQEVDDAMDDIVDEIEDDEEDEEMQAFMNRRISATAAHELAEWFRQ
jgi:hypothetical protein